MMNARVLMLALAATVFSGCPGCGELPCDEPNDTGAARCPTGQVCVERNDPLLGTRELCASEGAKTLNEPCDVSEECEGYGARIAVCADMHRTCPDVKDPNCDLRCRPVCRGNEECGPSQICWTGGGDIPGVCQEGECGESDRRCPDGLECTWFKAGDTGGICYAPCDVLRQAECRQSPPPQDVQCCAPQESCVHFTSNPQAASCLPKGRGALGELCDTEEANNLPSCNEGLFCSDQLPCPSGACTFRCVQYCNRGSGGPVCNQAGAICTELPGGAGLQYGYCQ